MPEITIVADTGRKPGTRPAARLRREGKIPAVIYGHGIDPIAVAVDGRELRTALSTDAGVNALLSLSVDGQSHLTMARVIQRHPVRHTVIHVDFQVVRRDEVMSVEVSVTLVGEAEAVHRGDGVVAQEMYALTVKATPDRIPHAIEVDISALEVGATIRVGDLKLPPGVSTDVDPESPVVVGQPPQAAAEMAAVELEAAEEAAAPSEGAAEAGGVAAAEGGDAGQGAEAGGGSEPGA
jgi:large subunit ribosomal protein L25